MTEQTTEPAPAQPQPDEATQRMVEAWLTLTRGALSYELDDVGVAAVRAGAARLLGGAAKLRAYPLVNADEPQFIFRPYRAEG